MLTYSKTILIFIGLSIAYLSNAQILDQYVAQGLEGNQALLREQLNTQIQQQRVKEAKGQYLPNVFFDASYILADGGRTIDVPFGDLLNPIYGELNQLNGSDVFDDNLPNASEQFLPNDFHETKITLIQPILNADIYYNRQIQGAQLSAQEARQKAVENELIKQIKVAYYQHLSAQEQVEILRDTKGILLELVRVSKKQVANDRATKEVVYGSEAELSKLESQIAAAERQVNTSRIFFNYLISRDLNEEIVADSTQVESKQVVPLTDLQNEATDNRNEIDQIKYGLEASRSAIALNKGYVIPDINVVGDLGYQGFGYEFDNTQDFWFLRFGLKWPIFNGFQNKSKIQRALLEERKLQSDLKETQDLVSLEVAETYYALEEAVKVLESRKRERRSATENFRIIQKKYTQSQVILVQFNEARNALTTAQLQEIIAKYNVKIKEAELEAATNQA